MMMYTLEKLYVAKLILQESTLSLILKKDIYSDSIGSINFLDVVYFHDTGVVNKQIEKFEEGVLNFSSRTFLSRKKMIIDDYKQFFICTSSEKEKFKEIIVVCKKVELSDDPYLYSHMK